MNITESVNQIIGAECGHGSCGLPIKEVIKAVNLNITNENASIEFESGYVTEMPMETLENLLEQFMDGYAQVQYNPWSCSTTNREGMLEELTIY
jgi:hypothetical protein